MSPEEILAFPSNVLTQTQKESFFFQGYLLLEGFTDVGELEVLRDVMRELASRGTDPDNSPVNYEFEQLPETGETVLRQILSSADFSSELWRYASTPPIVDLVADLVGPNVMFWQSNVAFKVPGGRGFPWHQDYAFIGASNLSPMMVFTFLEDVVPEMGPTIVVPGSHLHKPYEHYDEERNWVGLIADHELGRIPTRQAVEVTGPAGSLFLASCNIVHRAEPNNDTRARPMVINGYMSADTYCYVESPYHSQYNWRIIRGEQPGFIDSNAPRTLLPPDWTRHAGVRIDNLEHDY